MNRKKQNEFFEHSTTSKYSAVLLNAFQDCFDKKERENLREYLVDNDWNNKNKKELLKLIKEVQG